MSLGTVALINLEELITHLRLLSSLFLFFVFVFVFFKNLFGFFQRCSSRCSSELFLTIPHVFLVSALFYIFNTFAFCFVIFAELLKGTMVFN